MSGEKTPMTDDKKTESEILFEIFCDAVHIPYVRIPCGAGKTPDYDITPGGNKIVAEVKQIEPGDDDERLLSAGASWSDQGRRVRQKIDAAKRQLKARSGGRFPALSLSSMTMKRY